jgi:NitT/TauT family transport system substrate-binding protein
MIALEYGIPTDKEAVQLRLGIAKGFFRDEGIDLSIRVVFGGPEIARALDSGALKFGELGSPPATTAISRGALFRIIASGVRRRAVQYFVAAPSVHDWRDLEGHTVAALSIGSCSYWFMRDVLQQHGLNPDKDVKVIGLNHRYPHVVDLFANGELAGAVLSEPNVSIGEGAGVFRVMRALTEPAFCPGMQWGVVVASPDTLLGDPELVRAVLRGCRRSYRHAADNRDEWIAFGAEHFGISRETMARSIARELEGLHFDGEVDLAGLQQAIDLQRRLGAIKHSLRARDIVDSRFVTETSNA